MKKAVSIRAVIPNVITIIALSLGLTAIKFTLEQNFYYAVICVVLAAVLDAADGRIARLIKGTSKFGAELDSLADFVNFGVAPALIVYIWELNAYGNIGWLVTLIFIICCCLRLARFNVLSESPKSPFLDNFFTGVPSPAGAGILYLFVHYICKFIDQYQDYTTSFIIKSAYVSSFCLILALIENLASW